MSVTRADTTNFYTFLLRCVFGGRPSKRRLRRIRATSIVAAHLLFVLQVFSQWSTSTNVDSALYVCPGFYSGILTFDDGSSIILGALSGSIYAQKLSASGYKLWVTPVLVFQNDSSDILAEAFSPFYRWGRWASDGDGGIILFWYDHRGAYNDGQEYLSNSLFAQRVDKNGNVRWGSAGVLIRSVETGKKTADILSDGNGGCIIGWGENSFNYPGAQNLARSVAGHWDSLGNPTWELSIDSSSTMNFTGISDLQRAGSVIYASGMHEGNLGTFLFRMKGILDDRYFWSGGSLNVSWKDSLLYRLGTDGGIHCIKLSSVSDTLWSTSVILPSGCPGLSVFRNIGFFPDGEGGAYFLYACQDTIYHFDSVGNYQRKYFPLIGERGGWVFPSGDGGVVASSDDDSAQRYDPWGIPQWPPSYNFLRVSGNAYFSEYASDNNGGIITSFWTTNGGISAQHTGRSGQVGIIDWVNGGGWVPEEFSLRQNYPNPFNPRTVIRYSLQKRSAVVIIVFDILGHLVSNNIIGEQPPGEYSFAFKPANIASGVYFYSLVVDGVRVATHKMTFLK